MPGSIAPRTVLTIAAFAAALAFPFVASGYHLYQGAQVLILAIALIGLNLLTGFNGQISLGHGAFFAIGGYGAAILTAKLGVPYYLAIPIASLVCFGAGFLFGFPALRFGGLYLALATFALAVATPQILAFKGFDAWTGGSSGVSLMKPHAPFALPLSSDQWLYLVCLLFAAVLYAAARNLVTSRIGRALIALRDQPIAAEAMGVNAAFMKTTCFGISALYAGVAGGLSAIAVGFVSPESFGLALSLSFLVGIVVGGLASLGGVLFGALFIEFVPNLADQLVGQLRRERQGLARRDLRRASHSGDGRHARRSRGRAAGGDEVRGALALNGGGGPFAAAKDEKGRTTDDHSTFASAIRRGRDGFRCGAARRAGRHARHYRHGNQDRPDHALQRPGVGLWRDRPHRGRLFQDDQRAGRRERAQDQSDQPRRRL